MTWLWVMMLGGALDLARSRKCIRRNTTPT
jgi:hypothetical protein